MAGKNQSDGRRGALFNAVEKPYRVGYGRPPTETQFKPEISGNPKGRNKKAPSFFSGLIERVPDEKIELRVGDRVHRRESTTQPKAQLHSAPHPEHRS